MNTEEKLALSSRSGRITLIREGIFLRCYQQSLFSLIQSAYPGIKIIGKRVKKLGGQVIYYAGFPETSLAKILPDAVWTDWGAEAEYNEFDEQAYVAWLEGLPLPASAPAAKPATSTLPADNRQIELSDEICRFLAHWEPGRFPASVDAGFIQGLKLELGV